MLSPYHVGTMRRARVRAGPAWRSRRTLGAAAFLVLMMGATACVSVTRVGDPVLAGAEPSIVADAGSWAARSSMPTARSEVAVAAVDGVLYVVGGLDDLEVDGRRGRSLSLVEAYDPALDSAKTLAPVPGPRDHAAAAAWDGRVYVSGGGEILNGAAYADLWAYDPGTDAWAPLPSLPRPRWQHAMVAIDGSLYLVGGFIGGSDDHAPTWAYDLASGTWRTDLAPLPTPRDHLAAVAVDGRIFALGGRAGGNLRDVEIYDLESDAWSRGPDLLVARSGITAVLLGDALHVAGGEDFTTGRTIGAHERLDLGTMRWSPLPDLPTPRHGLGSGVVDGAWYVITGGVEVGLSTSDVVEAWTPAP